MADRLVGRLIATGKTGAALAAVIPGRRMNSCSFAMWDTRAMNWRPTTDRSALRIFQSSLRRPETIDFLKRNRGVYRLYDRAVDAILLQGVAALVREIRDRLKAQFAVTMITDIFMEWQPRLEGAPLVTATELTSWEIQNVKSRNKQLDLAKIETFKKDRGFPLEDFIKAFGDADAKKRSGPSCVREFARCARHQNPKGSWSFDHARRCDTLQATSGDVSAGPTCTSATGQCR